MMSLRSLVTKSFQMATKTYSLTMTKLKAAKWPDLYPR
jgi:hypothetical protein